MDLLCYSKMRWSDGARNYPNPEVSAGLLRPLQDTLEVFTRLQQIIMKIYVLFFEGAMP